MDESVSTKVLVWIAEHVVAELIFIFVAILLVGIASALKRLRGSGVRHPQERGYLLVQPSNLMQTMRFAEQIKKWFIWVVLIAVVFVTFMYA